MIRIDCRTQSISVILVDQSPNRHAREVSVAKILSPICVRPAHCFGHEMIAIGRGGSHLGEIIAFKNVEHLDQYHSARRWWRHRDYLISAIAAAYGLTLF